MPMTLRCRRVMIALVLTLAMGICTRAFAQNPSPDDRAGSRTPPIEQDTMDAAKPVAGLPEQMEVEPPPRILPNGFECPNGNSGSSYYCFDRKHPDSKFAIWCRNIMKCEGMVR